MSHTAAPKVAFIFDCDGTLVNSTPVWGYAQLELLRRHGIDGTVDDFAQFEHLSLEDECQAYHDTWGIGANGEELYRELSDILIDGYSKVRPRDGLLAYLEQAKAAGIAMCVATSTPAKLVQSALAGAGLDAYMEFVTTTGEAGRSKQFPDVYELALRRLEERHGNKFERAWVFEDAVFGLKSSGVAGFKRVGIYDPHGRMKRDDVVQLSLTFLGFEVARMEFSPNDVLLIDRYNKRYVRAKYSDMKFLQQAGLDFNALQALFWGELFRPGHESVGNGSDFQLASSGSHTLLSLNNTPQLKYVFSTLTEQAVIDGMTAQNKNTTRNGKLEWKYADFTTLNNRPFPTTMKCAVTGLGKNFGFSLTLSRIDHATGWEGHTSVSSKYTPMKADDLLGKLINMK